LIACAEPNPGISRLSTAGSWSLSAIRASEAAFMAVQLQLGGRKVTLF
jgi:hypothetical protein